MAGEKGVENYQHSDLESKTSESATEIAEQNIVSEMARVPPNESDYASPSEKVISDVIETFRIGPLELEYQNCKVKNMERHSKNGLPLDHPPQFKSFGENREVTDEPCPGTRPYISSAGYHIYTADGVCHFYPWDSENREVTDEPCPSTRPYISSAGYHIYTPDGVCHFYPWDSENFDYRPRRHAPNSSKSNGFSSNDLNGPSASYNVSSNSRMKSHQVPSSSGKSSYHSQQLRQLHKECYSAMRSSSPRNHHQHGNASVKPRNDFGFTSLQSYKDQHSDLESKTSESATEIAEQNIVSEMARVPPNESDYASPSEKVISDVIETFRIGPLELEYQNCQVKNMERHSKNGLPMHHPPQFKSFGENRKVTDEPCPSTRPYISSAGYHIYTADGVCHFYPRDSENCDYRPRRRAPSSSKSNGFSSNDLNGRSASYNVSSNSRVKSHQVPSSSGKSSYHSQPLRQLHKECYPAMRSSSPRNHHQHSNASVKPRNDFVFTSLQSYKGNGDSDVSKELICGPRALGCDDSVKTNETEEDLPYFSRRKNFNLPDFQTEYVNAKFYIIKSFGEDNVHKSVKYGVWSSTPYGNEKLEVAYHEAKAKGIETGKKCPIFLFFSVERSGKFVGLAEMIGRVDFNRDLDFWQLKWSGFFPVKWHILKDIPHSKMRHIILKENDNRPVTCTRDTQEINLCQGIEMLKIFKNYSAKTSLLDDFFFYENREKLRVAERKRKSERLQSEECESDSYRDEDAAGYGRSYRNSARVDMTSVICRTRNLSLNPGAP